MSAEVRHGRYQDVLANVTCDTVIVDAPYSAKTHEGAIDETAKTSDGSVRTGVGYSHWGGADIEEFVSMWSLRASCWIVSITDDVLAPMWRAAYERHGLYAFATVGIVVNGMGVRMLGDGPASWTLHLMVARQRRMMQGTRIWRALPGGYVGTHGGLSGGGHEGGGGRGKPAWLLEALVRDYSDPGMTICDPCAGWGTTLTAAVKLGRNAIGAEMDREAFDICDRTLRGLDPRPSDAQPSLLTWGGAA